MEKYMRRSAVLIVAFPDAEPVDDDELVRLPSPRFPFLALLLIAMKRLFKSQYWVPSQINGKTLVLAM